MGRKNARTGIAGSGSAACPPSPIERVNPHTVLAKLPNARTASLNAGTILAFGRHDDLLRLAITADNGEEFVAHAELTAKPWVEVYFATPYHASERAVNEETNGLVGNNWIDSGGELG